MKKKSDHMNLDKVGKKYPFYTPDNYFDQFHGKLMTRIDLEKKSSQSQIFIRYLKPAIGLAASFLLIITLLYVPVKLIFHEKNITSNSTMPAIDEEYFLSYPLSDHKIFEALESTVPDETFDNDQLESVLLASLSEYDLINLKN